MPIATGSSDARLDSYIRQREVVMNEEAFVNGTLIILDDDSVYNFENIKECRFAFYTFFIAETNTPFQVILQDKSTNMTELRTVKPNTLFAPFRMKVFGVVSELVNYSMTRVANLSVDEVQIRVILIPFQSQVLSSILTSKYIAFVDPMLLIYDKNSLGDVNFVNNELKVSQNCHVVFPSYTYIGKLKVECSRHNNVFLYNGKTALTSIVQGTMVDDCIEMVFDDTGIYSNIYEIRIVKCTASIHVVQLMTDNRTCQIVLHDEFLERATESIVTDVTAVGVENGITNWSAVNGLIWLSTTNSETTLRISFETDTGIHNIDTGLNMNTVTFPAANFEAVNLIHAASGDIYTLKIVDPPNVEVFQNGIVQPHTKIRLGTLTLRSGKGSAGREDDLLVNDTNVLESTFHDMQGDTSGVQIGRSKFIFDSQNRVRVDQKSDAIWEEGPYMYINDQLESPFYVGPGNNSVRVQQGDILFSGMHGIQIKDT